jgi:hypothetical protein
MAKLEHKYPCPCCGYKVFDREPGSHQVCPICHWEDNLVQLRFPTMPGGANHVSLEDGQQNYAEFGAAERRHQNQVRSPFAEDQQDPDWRRLDRSRDNPESPARGVNYADSYPEEDFTVLYYWRENYWRRLVS